MNPRLEQSPPGAPEILTGSASQEGSPRLLRSHPRRLGFGQPRRARPRRSYANITIESRNSTRKPELSTWLGIGTFYLVLTDGSPQIMRDAVDLEKHLIQMPFIAGRSTPSPQAISELLAELIAPTPDRFVAHHHATGCHHLLYVAKAHTEPEVQPPAFRDDFLGESMATIGVVRHSASIASHSARQPDNAQGGYWNFALFRVGTFSTGTMGIFRLVLTETQNRIDGRTLPSPQASTGAACRKESPGSSAVPKPLPLYLFLTLVASQSNGPNPRCTGPELPRLHVVQGFSYEALHPDHHRFAASRAGLSTHS